MPPPEIDVSIDTVVSALRDLAVKKSEWAGLAMPINDYELVTEPRYPYHIRLCQINEEDQGDAEIVNKWFSRRLRGSVFVVRDPKTGKSRAVLQPWNSIDMLIGTVYASRVWPIEAETRALEKLQTLIPDHMFRNYIMAGAIVETSQRSGISYIFRKLRPTIAIKPAADGQLRFLCALCLHPIGYYAGTWAGTMVPTDDLIAHLLLMRGDERHFWKQANQHGVFDPGAGL